MSETGVKGRLAQSFDFWEGKLEAPPFVRDIIKQGYSFPFQVFTPHCFLSNNRSALRNPLFAQSVILGIIRVATYSEAQLATSLRQSTYGCRRQKASPCRSLA